eukprot:TRINITY_DN16894_c0_g1_i4.p1 TRINITY_DN16894_c0_g1~~TRINITY_DN16894_c0_g1_i4.p1  ORF type:complete len:322 (-),score=86.05 TRINITY_DN16894_c0_g1_i4:360-1325(-)
MTDASCQTDSIAVPTLLPDTYPANLLYAQSMLAITMSQMNQVELHIQQLRSHLLAHELHAKNGMLTAACSFAGPPPLISPHTWLEDRTAAAVGSRACTTADQAAAAAAGSTDAATAAGAVNGVTPEVSLNAAPADEAVPQADPAAGDAGAAPAAAAAAAGDGAEGNLRIHRMRLAAAVKGALVMLLLDFKAAWFFLYFFGVFLYVGGMFDPIIEFLSRGQRSQQTLEQQLTALRHRQRMAERKEEERQRAAASAAAAGENQGEAAAGEGAEQTTAAAESTPPPPEPEEPPRAPEWQRCVYQLVIMFFLTLMPWWTPNPYYL